MTTSRGERRGSCLRLALAPLLAAGACLVGTLFAVNRYPHLLMRFLGLEQLGIPTDALPPGQAPLALAGEGLDHVDLLLPPRIPTPLALTASDASDGSSIDDALIGDASALDTTKYLITINEDSVGRLLSEVLFTPGLGNRRYEDVVVDLHPGGLTLYADVDLGIRQHRMGLLLLQDEDELTLSPAGIILGRKLYGIPPPGSLGRLFLPARGKAQRALHALTIVGPLPGEAQVEAIRFHHNSLQVLAQATYISSSLPDTGWRTLEEGVALREIDVTPGSQRATERLSIIRVDQTDVQLRICYDPVNPRTVSEWGRSLNALVVVNGSYFAPRSERGYETIGLLISDGQRWGTPLQDHAGMLAVTLGGEASVRWLRQRPYDPQEPLIQAMQSFPMLVKPSGIMGFPADADDGAPARRTVVAQDDAGNLLLIAAPRGTLSLHDLAVFLARSELDVDVALNLDGGGSTGMWVGATNAQIEIDSLVPVPSVVAIQSR